MIKSILATVAFLAMSGVALATPVNLGAAGNYTLLATGYDWLGTMTSGSMQLGSEAQIHGNVGARTSLGLSSGAVVYGNADYGSLSMAPSSSITGTKTQRNEAFFDSLYSDLETASDTALSYGGTSMGAVNSSQTFSSTGALSVFNISSLNLSGGDSLTLSGNSTDEFIINIGGNFMLGGGASIILDGVSADNVLFNMYGDYAHADINAAAGTMYGTFIAPDGRIVLGDGLHLNGVRFLGAYIQGNLQVVNGPTTTTSVPEPASLPMMMLGLIGLAFMARRRRKS